MSMPFNYVCRVFYEDQAFLAQAEDPQLFLALVMTLSNVSFELDFNEEYLNTSSRETAKYLIRQL